MKPFKANILIIAVYLTLCFASLIFFIVDQPNKFSSIFIVLLTFPWSFALTEILYRSGIAIKGLLLNSCVFVIFTFLNSLLLNIFIKLIWTKKD
ncbi:SCO4225 family membrane protein [Geotalea uraniireducens]